MIRSHGVGDCHLFLATFSLAPTSLLPPITPLAPLSPLLSSSVSYFFARLIDSNRRINLRCAIHGQWQASALSAIPDCIRHVITLISRRSSRGHSLAR